jgi:hypothetical protein
MLAVLFCAGGHRPAVHPSSYAGLTSIVQLARDHYWAVRLFFGFLKIAKRERLHPANFFQNEAQGVIIADIGQVILDLVDDSRMPEVTVGGRQGRPEPSIVTKRRNTRNPNL